MPRWDSELLSSIDPDTFRAYLSYRGWEQVQEAIRGASNWIAPARSAAIALPEDEQLEDYALRIRDALQVVAETHGESPDEILDQVLTITSDILRFRSVQDAFRDGSIPLDSGVDLFDGIRETLAVGAKSFRQHLPYYGQKNWPDAEAFLRKARLGQTERGSYIVTVLSRIPQIDDEEEVGPVDEQPTLPGMPTQERQILETLVEALAATREAIESYRETQDPVVFQEAVPKGVSLDLCAALVELTDRPGRSTVEVAPRWSPLVPVTRRLPEVLVFEPADVAPLRRAIDEFKQAEIEPEATVMGWIETLARHEEGTGPGEITIVAESGVPTGRKVRVALDTADYERAIGTHSRGARVIAAGTLTRIGNRFWLLDGRLIRDNLLDAP